jgi:hypothetical protein
MVVNGFGAGGLDRRSVHVFPSTGPFTRRSGAFFTPGDSTNVGLDAPCIADVSLILLGSKPMRRSASWPKMQ